MIGKEEKAPRKEENPMQSVYDYLITLGHSESYIKQVCLPDWWEDHLADVPFNKASALASIAGKLGIDYITLSRISNHE